MPEVVIVFGAALITAVATGLGPLPLLAWRHTGRSALGLANAAASGVMLGASLMLVLEAGDRSWSRCAIGFVAGALFVAAAEAFADNSDDLHVGSLRGEDARRALLIVGVMTVHSAAEGIGIGSAFGGGETLGWVIAIAIAVHNIPEGLAIGLVLVPRGVSVRSAAGWSIFSSLPQPVLAVPAFLFVETFESTLPLGLGFAGGAMAWLVARELLPDAVRDAKPGAVVAVTAAAFAMMTAFQAILI